jgi:hypothetical protein
MCKFQWLALVAMLCAVVIAALCVSLKEFEPTDAATNTHMDCEHFFGDIHGL